VQLGIETSHWEFTHLTQKQSPFQEDIYTHETKNDWEILHADGLRWLKSLSVFYEVCYLTILSVSRSYSADEMMVNEYKAFGGMTACRRNVVLGENVAPSQFCSFHQKSHMI
jgi:hypothetical protein